MQSAWKRLTALAVLSVTLIVWHPARADVVYNWVNLEPGPDDITLQASIAINDAYWSFGGSLHSVVVTLPDSAPVIPYFGLDEISVAAYSGVADCSQFFGRQCFGTHETGPAPCGVDNCRDADTPIFGSPQYYGANSFDLTTGLFVTGSIDLSTIDAEVEMHSDGIYWTVTGAKSDQADCQSYYGCGGEVGVWVLDLASLPVPEPGTLSLLALGLVGVGFTRRRKTEPRK